MVSKLRLLIYFFIVAIIKGEIVSLGGRAQNIYHECLCLCDECIIRP